MKLVGCKECYDIIVLSNVEERKCWCGKVSGRYVDSRNAEINADPYKCFVIGFNNESLRAAVMQQDDSAQVAKVQDMSGKRFEAFVIPRYAATVSYTFTN